MRTLSVVFAAVLVGCGSSEDPAPITATDAAVDTATVTDTGVAEEVSTDAGVKCTPQPITGWTPKWYPPAGAYQGKCTAAEIHDLVIACTPPSPESACLAALDKKPDCSNCMTTDAYATSTGAIIRYTTPLNLTDRNVGGCFALKLGDSSASGCGAKVRAAVDCALQSCGKVCPYDPVKGFAALNLCQKKANADATLCKAYFDAADKCVTDNIDKVRECSFYLTDGEPVADVWERYGKLFCGTAPASDAGTD